MMALRSFHRQVVNLDPTWPETRTGVGPSVDQSTRTSQRVHTVRAGPKLGHGAFRCRCTLLADLMSVEQMPRINTPGRTLDGIACTRVGEHDATQPDERWSGHPMITPMCRPTARFGGPFACKAPAGPETQTKTTELGIACSRFRIASPTSVDGRYSGRRDVCGRSCGKETSHDRLRTARAAIGAFGAVQPLVFGQSPANPVWMALLYDRDGPDAPPRRSDGLQSEDHELLSPCLPCNPIVPPPESYN